MSSEVAVLLVSIGADYQYPLIITFTGVYTVGGVVSKPQFIKISKLLIVYKNPELM